MRPKPYKAARKWGREAIPPSFTPSAEQEARCGVMRTAGFPHSLRSRGLRVCAASAPRCGWSKGGLHSRRLYAQAFQAFARHALRPGTALVLGNRSGDRRTEIGDGRLACAGLLVQQAALRVGAGVVLVEAERGGE